MSKVIVFTLALFLVSCTNELKECKKRCAKSDFAYEQRYCNFVCEIDDCVRKVCDPEKGMSKDKDLCTRMCAYSKITVEWENEQKQKRQ